MLYMQQQQLVNNTAVGANALEANTTGQLNTAIGTSVLVDNTTGSNNVGVGEATLFVNTTGSRLRSYGLGCITKLKQ